MGFYKSIVQMLRLFIIPLVLLFLFFVGYIVVTRVVSPQQYTFRSSSQTVIKELKSLNRLETAAFTIEKVIDAGTSGNRFQELLFGDRILLIAHGQVIAGFDLATLGDESVTVDGQSLRITLPPPMILITKLDAGQTRVYDRKQGLLSKGDKDLESQARLEAEKMIMQAACSGGILEEASGNARSQLSALFKSVGFTSVTISIPSGSCE